MLHSQFIEFHVMEDSLIPAHLWQDAKVHEKQDGEDVIDYHRMDILWSFLDNVKDTSYNWSEKNFLYWQR